jgi:hypothetical protein
MWFGRCVKHRQQPLDDRDTDNQQHGERELTRRTQRNDDLGEHADGESGHDRGVSVTNN